MKRFLSIFVFLISAASLQGQHSLELAYHPRQFYSNIQFPTFTGEGPLLRYIAPETFKLKDTGFQVRPYAFYSFSRLFLMGSSVTLNTPNKDGGTYEDIAQSHTLHIGLFREHKLGKTAWSLDYSLGFGLGIYDLYSRIRPNQAIEGYREKVFRVNRVFTPILAADMGINYRLHRYLALKAGFITTLGIFKSYFPEYFNRELDGIRFRYDYSKQRVNYLSVSAGLVIHLP